MSTRYRHVCGVYLNVLSICARLKGARLDAKKGSRTCSFFPVSSTAVPQPCTFCLRGEQRHLYSFFEVGRAYKTCEPGRTGRRVLPEQRHTSRSRVVPHCKHSGPSHSRPCFSTPIPGACALEELQSARLIISTYPAYIFLLVVRGRSTPPRPLRARRKRMQTISIIVNADMGANLPVNNSACRITYEHTFVTFGGEISRLSIGCVTSTAPGWFVFCNPTLCLHVCPSDSRGHLHA